MIDSRTEHVVRVKVLDDQNNVDAFFAYIEKEYPDTCLKDCWNSKYAIDYLEDCLMIDGDYTDLIEISEKFPRILFYGVYGWDDGDYHARQVVATNGKCWCVSWPVTLGYKYDKKNFNIGEYMHLYGTSDAVDAGKACYGWEEKEGNDRVGS